MTNRLNELFAATATSQVGVDFTVSWRNAFLWKSVSTRIPFCSSKSQMSSVLWVFGFFGGQIA